MSQPQTSWVGQVIGGRYEIESQLGHGGMSTVYRANDPNLRRKVAIKIVHPHLTNDKDFVRRFEQEATAVAQLRHHHIIQVYDFDHDNQTYFMVLEYVAGETLQARLKTLNETEERLTLADVIRLMIIIAEAVDYAHSHGMIHRDLKPANVMLNRQNEPILMDFGVAKILGGTDHTATGTVIGTALYMSPEQAKGERPDARADIYSLGAMLYEMVSGRPPFDGDTVITIMLKHVTEPVPDIRQFNKDVPEALLPIIDKVLAKDPEARYQSAGELADVLRMFAVDQALLPELGSALPFNTTNSLANTSVRTQVMSSEAATSPAAASPAAASSNRWIMLGGAALVVLAIIVGAIFFLSGNQPTSTESALPPSDGMVNVPAGTYTVGRDDVPARGDYAAMQQVSLPAFWLDQYEVTNNQYAQFLADSDFPPPAAWDSNQVPAGLDDYPVEGITWTAAQAYCESVHKRLPHEAEWEVAARGAVDQLYPWGNDVSAVDLPNGQTYPVGSIAANRSPFGVYDMAGNVWEWVDQIYAPVPDGNRVLRGGAHGFLKDMAYRLHGDPTTPSLFTTAGVRCAADTVEGE